MENPFSRPYENFVKAKSYLAEFGYCSGEFLDFRLEVLGVQLQAVPKLLAPDLPAEKAGLLQDLPSSCWNSEAASNLYRELCVCLERWEIVKGEEAKILFDADLRAHSLVLAVRDQDKKFFEEAAKPLKDSPSPLFFLAEELARPMLSALTPVAEEVIQENPERGSCPICGHEPLLARILKKDNKRVLHCSLCTGNWNATRLQCPHCNEQPDSKVKFFFHNEADPFQVEVCDSCKRYVKTLFESRIPDELDPLAVTELFHYATPEVDQTALNEGYVRISNSLKNHFGATEL